MALLDNLSEYADRLDKKAVVDKVWPNLVREPSLLCLLCDADQDDQQSGFTDTVPVIREATIRAIVLLSPKVRFEIFCSLALLITPAQVAQ